MADKKILYIAVCRGEVVLCEYSEDKKSKLRQFTQDILRKIKSGKKVLEYDKCDYMVEKESGGLGRIYLIVVEKGFSKQVGFTMLDKMRTRFEQMADPRVVEAAKPLSLNPKFQEELRNLHVSTANAGHPLGEQRR